MPIFAHKQLKNSNMTAHELMEILEGVDPETEIRFASQPSWPFEYEIRGTVESEDGIIYLTEGRQLGYLPKEIADQAW